MTKKILFLDLDRTLFDTDYFMQSLWGEIAARYNINKEHELARTPEWYRAMGEYRYYDLREHLEQGIGLNPDDVVSAVTPALSKLDFLYADVADVLALQKEHADYEFRVLTFGPEWVQKLKLQFVPAIRDLACDIILLAKNEFIAAQYPGVHGYLVDDKRNRGLPGGVKEVWINRTETLQSLQKYDILAINSLTQIKGLL